MGSWDDVLKNVSGTKSQCDYVRGQSLKKLHEYTKRNVIAYYSAFLNKPGCGNEDINDSDMTGFMTCVHGLDCDSGLDLILHTPGGQPEAAESIINYLRIKFNNDIRIIVPHMAMSAGTMMACAGKEIIMGRHSSLGPIDPQFNGIPAYNIKAEFEDACDDLTNHPERLQFWQIKLSKYPAAFAKTAIDAIELSTELTTKWLGTCMFNKKRKSDTRKIVKIVDSLNEHKKSKTHGRHYNVDFCKKIGLKIVELESDDALQDLVLSLHHAFFITFDVTSAKKIIENQNHKAYICHENRVVGR